MKTLCLFALVAIVPLPRGIGQDRKARMAEYARRYAAVDQKDVAAMLELAAWCDENELKTYANLLYRRLLKLDPQNARANTALGNVQVAGRWHPPKEAAKLRAKLAAAERAAGARAHDTARASMVEIPDEAELRASVKAKIVESATAARRLRDAYAQAVGAPLNDHGAALSEHATVVARASLQDAQRYAEIAEYVYRRMSWITFGKRDARSFARDGNRHIFYLTEPTRAAATLEFVARQHPSVARWNDVTAQADAIGKLGLEFIAFHKPPCLVHLQLETQSSAVANTMARSFVQHHAKPWYAEPDLAKGTPKGFSMMSWLLEGTGIWASLAATGRNEVFRVNSRYARRFVKTEDPPPNYPGMAYDIVTTGKTGGKPARAFAQLCRARLESWSDADLAMSFAVVDYLIRGRTEDWRGLLQRLRDASSLRIAFVEQFGTASEQAKLATIERNRDESRLEALFRVVAGRFERSWRDWVRATYAELRNDPGKTLRDAPFPDVR